VCRVLCGWNRVDRYTCLLKRGGANDVSVLASGPGTFHVPARIARWDGDRQYALGCGGDAAGIAECVVVFSACLVGRAGNHPETPAERAASGDGAVGGAGLRS